MISNHRLPKILVSLSFLVGPSVFAQTLGYTKKALDDSWETLAEPSALSGYASAYLDGLNKGPAKLYPMAQAGGADRNASNGKQTASYRIVSVRLAPKVQRVMNDRQIDLLEYQRKIEVFEIQPAANFDEDVNVAIKARSDALSALSQRKQAIALELYYINVLRSYQATSLISKCRYLTEARNNRDQAGTLIDDTTSPLARIFKDVEASNKADVDARLPCRLSASLGQVQPKSVVESKINSSVTNKLSDKDGKVQVMIAKINEVTAGYEEILKDISVDPKTKQLLELQRNYANAKSNTELVSEDQLKVKTDIDALAKVDISKLDGLALGSENIGHPSIDKALDARKNLIESLRLFLQKIESIHTDAGSDQPSVELCKGLTGKFNAIFAGLENGDNKNPSSGKNEVRNVNATAVKAFRDVYSGCLDQTKTYIGKISKQTELDVFMEEFAAKLDQLNDRVRYEKSKG